MSKPMFKLSTNTIRQRLMYKQFLSKCNFHIKCSKILFVSNILNLLDDYSFIASSRILMSLQTDVQRDIWNQQVFYRKPLTSRRRKLIILPRN